MNRREVLAALPVALAATHAAAAEPPRPLSARGEVNLTAFARLVAYVRFFHPSDEAAATDWNAFVVSNIEAVEAARSPADLVKTLDAAFRPIAPTMALGLAGKPPPVAIPAATAGTLVMWKHRGVGLPSPGPNSLYRSERVPVPDGQPKILRLDLGGEITASMPTTAYSAQPDAKPATPAPVNAFSADDRKVRLADVTIAWGVLQHFYPYFDVAGGDWNAELPKALRAAAVDPDARQFRVTLARMVAALHDGHGNVFGRGATGRLPIGWSWIEDRLVITALPADGAPGLAVGGVITRIDGVDVRQRLAELDTEVCAATPQWLRFKSLQLLQQRDAPATLEGEGPDGQPFKAQLAPVAPDQARDIGSGTARANFSEPRPGVVYVDLARVTDADITSRMDQLAAAKGIVLDDRGYPSGAARKLLTHLSDRTLHSARFELPIFTAPDRRDVTFDPAGSWVLPPQAPRLNGKLVLLTGGGSISYAESWAGVFEGEGLGAIVGGPTAGTNGNINRLLLPGGYSILFTGMRVRKQDGSRHHGVGITPTVPVSQTVAGVRAGRDEVLERGVAVALGEA